MTDLEGCYSLPNPREVIRSEGDSTCGTGFVSEVFNVNVYPNPAANHVQVEVTGDMNQECQVEIYDGLGRLLYRDQVMPGVSESIDLSNMPHGQMYIRVIDQGEQKVKAFIKAGDN